MSNPTADQQGFRRFLADQVLAWLQKRCEHPGQMVAADVLEGSVDGLEVKYCRRCGAIKTDWKPTGTSRFTTLEHTWRRPDPNLWRGYDRPPSRVDRLYWWLVRRGWRFHE